MHEYSLMQQVIEKMLENTQVREGQVDEVLMRIGELDVHSDESMQQAWEMMSKGTSLEKARLKLELVPGTVDCPSCGYSGPTQAGDDGQHHHEHHDHDPLPFAPCPKCGTVSPVKGGRGVYGVETVLRES